MSVVNQVSICNMALVKVGAERISSIDQDCKRAIILKAIYDTTRDTVLGARKWGFAQKRAVLAPTGTVPDWGYNYEYDLPSDYVAFMDTDPDNIDYVIESQKIRTDESSLDVLYVYRNTDESSWPATFAKAFACLLARDIAYNLTQSSALVTQMETDYKAALGDAGFSSSAERPSKRLESTTWTDARKR